jgi:hypothetical protein
MAQGEVRHQAVGRRVSSFSPRAAVRPGQGAGSAVRLNGLVSARQTGCKLAALVHGTFSGMARRGENDPGHRSGADLPYAAFDRETEFPGNASRTAPGGRQPEQRASGAISTRPPAAHSAMPSLRRRFARRLSCTSNRLSQRGQVGVMRQGLSVKVSAAGPGITYRKDSQFRTIGIHSWLPSRANVEKCAHRSRPICRCFS